MARTLAQVIQNVVNSDGGITHDVIDIYLPVKGAETPIIWHWSDAVITVNGLVDLNHVIVNNIGYQNVITSMPRIRHSIGKGVDEADFEIENSSLLFSGLLHEVDRTFDGANCIINRAFLDMALYITSGQVVYNANEIMRGYIVGYRPTDENIKFRVAGDMTMRGRRIANRPIHEDCPALFNKNGLKSASVDLCGWQVSQGLDAGASATSCDKTPYGTNGCAAHRNLHRFAGYGNIIDPLSEETINADERGNGFPSDLPHPRDRDVRNPRMPILMN